MSLSSAHSLLLLADAWGMHDGDVGSGWMIAMMLFWGFVVVGVVWLLREALGSGRHNQDADPLAILDRRLAEGQLSVEEYEQSKRTLAG